MNTYYDNIQWIIESVREVLVRSGSKHQARLSGEDMIQDELAWNEHYGVAQARRDAEKLENWLMSAQAAA